MDNIQMNEDLQLNLLPWRENQKRLTLKRASYVLLRCLLSAIGIVLLAHVIILYLLHRQDETNSILHDRVKQLEVKAANIQALDNQQQKLLAHTATLNVLAKKSQEMSVLFNELAKITPDGVYLTSLASQAGQITLQGRAVTLDQAKLMLSNISSSGVFSNADIINSVSDTSEPPYQFLFTLKMQMRMSA